MNVESFQGSLQDIARQLRPVARSPFIPLVKLANRSGIEVELRFYSNERRREAQTDLDSSRPRILLYRKSTTNGIMGVTPEKEHLLAPRERFSIAHELGHYFAFKKFGALPVSRESDPQEYRRQESCMDEFAQTLLVPDWLGRLWLNDVAHRRAISPNSLKVWAVAQCGVSSEVVARALTRLEPSIGFLKAADAIRVASGKRLLVVFHSSYGAGLQLPNLHSFIEDETFVDKILGTSGARCIDACNLGNTRHQNLNVAWQESRVSTSRRRREFRSSVKLTEKGYWISIRADLQTVESAPNREVQLTLFD